MDTVTIIILVAALVLFIVLFFIAEKLTETKKKSAPKVKDKKPAETKMQNEPSSKAVSSEKKKAIEGNQIMIQELNDNNLANDLEKLLDEDEKSKNPQEERIFRSRLSNTGRMKQYYEHKHKCRPRFEFEDLESEGGEDFNTADDVKLTQDDVKKLLALQKLFDDKNIKD